MQTPSTDRRQYAFHWRRGSYTKDGAREWTPRRVAAAKQAMQRQADAMPLFPEFRTDAALEDRQARIDERETSINADMRAARAQGWRECRRLVRCIPRATRQAFLAKWNRDQFPLDPSYLISVYRMIYVNPTRHTEA